MEMIVPESLQHSTRLLVCRAHDKDELHSSIEKPAFGGDSMTLELYLTAFGLSNRMMNPVLIGIIANYTLTVV
ncbi:hypothetical protein TNCT_469871 [Trichonephila clavata]|uniref:Uncharacterized protein n=1 Tax=Trichonephila clavata TaxID=2740835 RepID=A0A8X6K5W0_TRICU|nr:hypothetical protein TNCT_469871 [Trichonephila clavata]